MVEEIMKTLNEIKEVPEGGKIQREDRSYLLKLISEASLTELMQLEKSLVPEIINQVSTHIEWLANGWY